MENIRTVIERLDILFSGNTQPIVMPMDIYTDHELNHFNKECDRAGYLTEIISVPDYEKFKSIKISKKG